MDTHNDNPNPNIFERIRRWKSSFAFTKTKVPDWLIFPLFSFCVSKFEQGWGARLSFGKDETRSLFYNGVFYTRIIFCPVWALPSGVLWGLAHQYYDASYWWLLLCIGFIGFGVRWAGKDPNKREYLQTYIGVKLIGEWALIPRFRIQSDYSAAKGTTGPNYGQAIGWEYGTK